MSTKTATTIGAAAAEAAAPTITTVAASTAPAPALAVTPANPAYAVSAADAAFMASIAALIGAAPTPSLCDFGRWAAEYVADVGYMYLCVRRGLPTWALEVLNRVDAWVQQVSNPILF